MKIAVCLSGQLRNWEIAHKNQIWFWEKSGYEVDYFVHTWDYSADRTAISKPYVYRDIDNDEYNRFIEIYKPKKHIFDSKTQEFFYDNDHWSSLFYSFSQSILLKREYELENGFEYDVVVKSRPDVVFDPHMKYNDYIFNNLYDNTLFSTHGGRMEHEFNMYNINDCVFFSNSYTMDILINIYFYRQQKINKNIPHYKNYQIMGPGVLIHEYCRDFGITPITDVGFHEVLIKDVCPTDLDLINHTDFQQMEVYFRQWYLN
jgi:hypothetical protein